MANHKHIGWQNVHALAIQSMAIVVGRKPVPKAWAFKVEVVDFGAGALAVERSENGGAHAAISTIPGGNHGDNLIGAYKSE